MAVRPHEVVEPGAELPRQWVETIADEQPQILLAHGVMVHQLNARLFCLRQRLRVRETPVA